MIDRLLTDSNENRLPISISLVDSIIRVRLVIHRNNKVISEIFDSIYLLAQYKPLTHSRQQISSQRIRR